MKIWIRRIISIALVIVLVLTLQRLVEPKYVSDFIEGGFTAEYYREKENHQVLMIGDCELYENFSPITLWRKYGITSYIRGNAQQLAWHSYYLLREALEDGEKPDVVVFSVLALKYNVPQKEEYNRMVFDTMRWSPTKAEAINVSMMPETTDEDTGDVTPAENFADYLFPILRYHSRICSLGSEDFEYFAKDRQRTTAGYYMRCDVLPVGADDETDETGETDETDGSAADETAESETEETVDTETDETVDTETDETVDTETEDTGNDEESADEEETDEEETDEGSQPLGSNAMSYLDKIRELCDKNGIKLVLVKAPSLSPEWYDTWNQQIVDYAQKYDLDYVNLLEKADEVGIDYNTDTYDGGLHMNIYGAEKCADYLGRYLKEHFSLKDMRSDPQTSAYWTQKEQFYEEKKADQLNQISKYGKVVSP